MNPANSDILRCPRCAGSLTLGRRADVSAPLEEGRLRCVNCRRTYPVRRGIPRLVVQEDLSGDRLQNQRSFSAKWNRVPTYGVDSEATRTFQREWYLRRYGYRTEARFRSFLSGQRSILDAGTGLGRDTIWYSRLSPGRIYGMDISSSLEHARRRIDDSRRVTLVQGDILRPPFAAGSFDFVACDQVLPNVADPPAAVRSLARLVRPGGHLAIYVYRRRGPLREFANDYLRERIVRMSSARAWKECEGITRLGRSLHELRVKFKVPRDIPLLAIKAGTYDLQRFFFYHVLKCFWNESHSFEENNLVNLDWYHPAFTFRYSEDEVRGWIRRLGLSVVHFDREEPSGISVLCRKPARR